ncbi:hypothetical protein OESDEN_02986 [Oesophagostomum dentatum]|uniref:Uncharacterized protein n=1 Tax=Oesophagostomum dentatum TaxID=61180 RepID=A0A0B1TNS1_OESDE|nr:hypothetical protein OESDEN_02986 [Oesophagostomum dentatum]
MPFNVVDCSSIASHFSPTSEASRDSPDFLLVLIICAIVCFALRHANDFYAGETITLVEEGVFSGRFRHKVEHRMLTTIEKDFNDMYQQLKDKEAVLVDADCSTSKP